MADKIAEDMRGKRQTAGQKVRVVDIPADTGVYGLFEDLHEFKSAAALADYLRDASRKYYGVASRSFIEKIAPNIERVAAIVKGRIQQFVDEMCPDGSNGQVKRVAARFGLIAAGGELATSLGVLPWNDGSAIAAAETCFKAWLDIRGGHEADEEKDGVDAVRAFLSAHGLSRFLPAWEPSDFDPPKTPNLAGYRKRVGSGDAETWDYFITSEAWPEVAAGFNKSALSETLVKRGFLLPVEGAKARSRVMKIKGLGDRRVYHISHTIFTDGAANG